MTSRSPRERFRSVAQLVLVIVTFSWRVVKAVNLYPQYSVDPSERNFRKNDVAPGFNSKFKFDHWLPDKRSVIW